MSFGFNRGPEPDPGFESQYDRYEFMKIDGAKARRRMAAEMFADSPEEKVDASVIRYSQKLAKLMFARSGSLGMHHDIDHEEWWRNMLMEEDSHRFEAYSDAFAQRIPERRMGSNTPASDEVDHTIAGALEYVDTVLEVVEDLEWEFGTGLHNLNERDPREQYDYLSLLLAEASREEVFTLRDRFQKAEYARIPNRGVFTRLYNRLPIPRREGKSHGA